MPRRPRVASAASLTITFESLTCGVCVTANHGQHITFNQEVNSPSTKGPSSEEEGHEDGEDDDGDAGHEPEQQLSGRGLPHAAAGGHQPQGVAGEGRRQLPTRLVLETTLGVFL